MHAPQSRRFDITYCLWLVMCFPVLSASSSLLLFLFLSFQKTDLRLFPPLPAPSVHLFPLTSSAVCFVSVDH